MRNYKSICPARGHDGGSWPAGQLPSPAEPDAGICRQWVSRDGGRSLSDLRPDGLVRCSHWARLLTLSHRCLQMVTAGW